jgi:hypothetical protein
MRGPVLEAFPTVTCFSPMSVAACQRISRASRSILVVLLVAISVTSVVPQLVLWQTDLKNLEHVSRKLALVQAAAATETPSENSPSARGHRALTDGAAEESVTRKATEIAAELLRSRLGAVSRMVRRQLPPWRAMARAREPLCAPCGRPRRSRPRARHRSG